MRKEGMVTLIRKIKPPRVKFFGHGSQQGTSTLFFISLLLVMSVLTGFMLDLTTTSTFSELSYNHLERAYFMAEGGGYYANRLIKLDIEDDTTYDDTYSLHGRTFTLDEAGQQEGRFKILVDDSDPALTRVHSIGTIDIGISSNVEVRLTYSMLKTTTSTPFSESLFAGKKLHLEKEATVNGDIGTNASNIQADKGVTINGEIETSAGRTLESIIFSCAGCNDDEEINGNKTWSSGTYEYKKLKMKKNTTLTINGDVTLYVKEDFIVEKDTVIKFLSNSSLTVYVDKKAEFKQGFSVVFDPQPDRPKDFVIYGTSHADTIKFEKESTFIGAIYAPDAHIHIEKGQEIKGSVIGNEIHIHKETTVTYDESVKEISSPVSGGGVSSVALGPPKQYFSF